MSDQRGRLLVAALGFAGLPREPRIRMERESEGGSGG
jgi:hypothetical protein